MALKIGALKKVVSASAIEDGVFLHLTDPGGEPLFLDEAQERPVRLKVRSQLSQAYEKHLDQVSRRVVQFGRKRKNALTDELAVEQSKKERPESFAVLVVAMENTDEDQPGLQDNLSREDLMEFARDPHNGWVVDQVMAFSADGANFGADAEGNAAGAGEP